jgi:rubrerythrin
MKLTQKESTLLKDMKNQEQLCADKYERGAESAVDPQLKKLFRKLAAIERRHYDTLTKIESGTVPKLSGAKTQAPRITAKYGAKNTADKQNDCYLCSDALATEKHTSSLYDTCVFEFTQENVRQVLNLIQKQEQEHGKMLYDYMKANNMAA